jgi:3-hydroxy-9,10-secoandrosta-1,3,5(10)-triene-9,17-dione monooxygenase reductase component
MNAAVKHPVPISEPTLKDAMRQVASGVCVITTGVGEERTGLTATSAVSLSVAPPTMIVCVNREASALPIIKSRRHFCINVLASRHRAVADRFAGRGGIKGSARYAEASWRTLATGALALEDALAAIDCEAEEFIERHSHVIVIGAVRALEVRPGRPLIYSQGQYGAEAPD